MQNRYYLEKVTAIEPLGGYRLRVTFADRFTGECDLSPLLQVGGPVFEPWRDEEFFRRGWRLEYGVPEWGDDLDLSPGSLRAWCEAGRFLDWDETDAWIATSTAAQGAA
jgi:hypothetical protein